MFLKSRTILLIFFALIAVIFTQSCSKPPVDTGISYQNINFRDVPGITHDEVRAVETLQREYNTFIFGMPLSVEAFEDDNGRVGGFSALLCEWLTNVFGIRFTPLLYDWLDLLDGLESGEIAFTGELTPTEERHHIYYMSNPIASRMLKTYRLISAAPLSEIVSGRLIRCGFIEGTSTINTVTSELEPGTYETVLLSDVSLVYNALKNSQIDVFYYSGTAEANFAQHADVVTQHFYPLTYRPVSLSTQKRSLEPVITILNKIIKSSGTSYINSLYNRGEMDFNKHRLTSLLTNEEKDYIRNADEIKFVAEYYNYPISFFNVHEHEWQGMIFDILSRVTELTGLKFTLANDQHTEWPQLLAMVENGDVPMSAELVRSRDREGFFLWPDNPTLVDNYTLVSRSSFPDKNINEVSEVRVGLVWGSVFAEIFNRWFPDHSNTVEYISSNAAFAGLEKGEVDMVMSSQHRLLAVTHYNEFLGYKANIVFDYPSESRFGFNINEEVLCSIMDKTLGMIDLKSMSDQWMRQTYDYRVKLMEARLPFLIGSSILFLFVIVLLVLLTFRNRDEGRKLETLVHLRTSELDRSQDELKTALETAKSANRSKSVFLANMSHEIRTPMNSIMGFAELALDSEPSHKTRDYLRKINTNADWLLQIINNILDLSKIESGKMELEKIPFNMHELFTSCRTLILPRATEKGLTLYFYAEPSMDKRPTGDPTRLRQVFVNLLSNAIKFTNSGIIKLHATLVNKSERSITMYFEVKDSGIGMTQKQIDKVFEPFAQAESGTTRKYGGTGLGLTITKNIIDLMGGKLAVESTIGVGSKFSFELTFDTIDSPDNDVTSGNILEDIEKPLFDGEVLLCEDNIMNQQVICEHLSRIGLRTAVAENGKIGVEMVKERQEQVQNNPGVVKQYDLIFMDMHMPVMDGLEASAKIFGLKTGVPIVAMTANVMSDDMEVYSRSGMHDCVGKPFTSQELWRCLLKYLVPIERDKSKEENTVSSGEADIEFQKSLNNLFIRTNREKDKHIIECINSGDTVTAHLLAHTLKSNAGQIKLYRLQAAAATVEGALKDGNNQVTAEQIKTLETELAFAINELEAMMSNDPAPEPPPLPANVVPPEPAKVKELFDELEILLAGGNPECLDYAEELRSIYVGDENKIVLIKQLIQYMEDFHFDAALSVIAGLKEK